MRIQDFVTFSGSPLEAINLHAKWLKRRGLRQGCAFCSKNRNFSYPLISRAPKGQNLEILWTFRKFSLDLAFNIRGHGENTPYSSPEPNECDIVNRQSGGEKLKYILKFYIGGLCHVISCIHNNDSALCL